MKTLLFLLLTLLLCSFASADTAGGWLTLPIALALIAGFYEVVIRVVPTAGNHALLGKIIDVLKWISDFLNRKKK